QATQVDESEALWYISVRIHYNEAKLAVLLAEGAFLPDHARMPLRAVHDVILRHLAGEHA
ncbi:MAG: hypothetical protein EBU31_12650, partial [Proteobacteria bacterium]|nr:hypothetical protein [Pseudomonadota bacterium]